MMKMDTETLLYSLLPPRLATVLIYRFLDGFTLRAIGKRLHNYSNNKLGVTQERVRHLIAKALRLLRHPVRLELIDEFLGNQIDLANTITNNLYNIAMEGQRYDRSRKD